jgi:hypothetical protein
MDDFISRTWAELGGRVEGPLSFRLILQPLIASLLAIRAGIADARARRPAYLFAVVTRPDHRRELLLQGWKTVAKVFTIAVVIDTVYQFIVYGRIHLIELLLVGFILACVPYLLVRGPANRIASMFMK